MDTEGQTPLPKLATCSYTAFRRDMGSPVRASLGAPRYIRLPDPRYGSFTVWPYLSEITPKGHYLKAPKEEYRAYYFAQLDEYEPAIREKLTWFRTPPGGTLVILCYEKKPVTDPVNDWCHRRFFAEWAERKWGTEVPELGDVRRPAKAPRVRPVTQLPLD